MKLKTLALVVAVLLLASLATWYFKGRDTTPQTDPRIGKPLVDPALITKLVTLHFRSDGKDITVTNTQTNGAQWIIREYFELPADFSKLSRLVEDVRNAKILRFATARPERLATMEFGDSVLELLGADGAVLWSAKLGKTGENGGRYIQLPGEEKAYLSSLNTWLDTTPKNWADAALVSIKPEQVTAFAVALGDGDTLHFTRENATAPWNAAGLAAGETIRESELSSVLARLTGLRFNETAATDAPDAVAARENARTFKLTLADGKNYTIALGRQPAPPAVPAPAAAPADAAKTSGDSGTAAAPPAEAPPAPKPGPVYAFISSSDPNDPINALMQRRAYQITEWTYTELPADRSKLIQPAPPTPAAAPAPATSSSGAAENPAAPSENSSATEPAAASAPSTSDGASATTDGAGAAPVTP